MALVVTDDKHYIDIANTIREKAGTESTFKPEAMPDGIKEIYETAKERFGVIGKETGTVVRADNVNENEHIVKVGLSSKNLLPFTPQTIECATGFYVTINEDGSITLNGESPYMNVTAIHTILSGQKVLKKGKTYTQTLRYADGSIVTNDVAYLSTGADWFKGDHYPTKSLAAGNNNVFTVEGAVYDDEYYEHEQFEANIVWQAGTYDNVTVYPQIEESTTATAYSPYVADVTSANVTANGKNLAIYPYEKATTTGAGITFTDNGDGSIHISGTATGTAIYYLTKPTFKAKAGDIFTLNMGTTCSSNFYFTLNYVKTSGGEAGFIGLNSGASKTGIIPDDFLRFGTFFIVVLSGRTVDVTVYPQLEVGSKATDWEPYSATQYTPNADGTLEIPPISPTTTLTTNKQGVNIECEYYQDGQAVIDELTDAIISLGGTI